MTKTKSLLLVYVLFSLLTTKMFSQTSHKLDSLLGSVTDEISIVQANLHTKIAHKYLFDDPIKALTFARKAKEFATSIADIQQLLEAMDAMAAVYQTLGEYEKGVELSLNMLKKAEAKQYKLGMMYAYTNLGVSHDFLRDYKTAQKYYNHALNMAIQLDNKKGEANIYNNMAILKHFANDLNEEYNYFVKAGEIYKELKDTLRLSDFHNNMASYYINSSKEPDRWKQAQYYVNQAIGLKKAIDDKKGLSASYLHLGKVWFELGDLNKSNNYMNKGFRLSNELEWKHGRRNYYKTKYQLAQRRNLFDSAFFYLLRFTNIKDSLVNEARNRQVNQLKVIYETEKKEQEIVSLKLEKRNERIRRNAYAGGLGLSVIIGLLTIYMLHSKIRTHKQLSIKEQQLASKKLSTLQSELDEYTAQLIERTTRIGELNRELEKVRNEISGECPSYRGALDHLMQSTILTNDEWVKYKKLFHQVHPGFFTSLRQSQSDLTETEERLLALTKLNLRTKEIAAMLGVSAHSVNKSRYRLRKKLHKNKDELENMLTGC